MSKCTYNFLSKDRIEKLMKIRFQKKKWGEGWLGSKCLCKLEKWKIREVSIWSHNLVWRLAKVILEKQNLYYALCRVILEVNKKWGNGPFLRGTLYQLTVTIQKYLFVNNNRWKLIENEDFEDMRTVLDNLMQEQKVANIGVVKRKAGIIMYKHEDSL